MFVKVKLDAEGNTSVVCSYLKPAHILQLWLINGAIIIEA